MPRPVPPAQIQRVIAQLHADGATHFGDAALETTVEWIATRPYSDVARVACVAGGQTTRVYVKVFRPRQPGADELAFMARRVASDFAMTMRLYEHMAAHPELSVPRPVACYPDLLALVTEAVEGLSLSDVIERDARFRVPPSRREPLEAALRRVARWLHVFQAAAPQDESLSLAEYCDYIDIRLRRLVAHRAFPFTDADRQVVLDGIAHQWARIPELALRRVLVHADLAPGNVLVRPDGVAVIDFAMSSTGSRLHDITHLFLQLDLLRAKPVFRPATVSALQQALLEAFDPGLTPSDPLFQLMLLQHVVCHASGLLHRPAGWLSRLYNRWVVRRHAAHLTAFMATAREGAPLVRHLRHRHQ